MVLDFAVYDRATVERPWPSYWLPATLIVLAGKHGIEIHLSFYGVQATNAGEHAAAAVERRIRTRSRNDAATGAARC
jgi:hypothetical protein